ncbi:MAG TPA: ERCC4 domain-containing protein [Candidatus Thermoplasmatota archaeon]|nr:ERCC4 domain-containing protein [Candidatus Thermoplasmatota archaeon]
MSEAAHPTPGGAPEPAPTIVVDTSEPAEMLELLAARGVQVERRRLAPADYVVGPIAIERKSVADFHASMIDKRLFEQVARMKETYPTCALVLEGDPAFFDERRSPRATWGALCSLAFDFELTVLPTSGREATAELLSVLAQRMMRDRAAGGGGGGGPEVRYKPRLLGPHAQQKFAVQGLPGIGDIVSESLLEHFGSVRRVYAASDKELLRAPGIGKGRAADITRFLDQRFEGRQRRLP